jgi:C1A family cysteine protease
MQKLYIMAHKIMRFGWQPDLPDQRDFAYKTPAAFIKALPSKVDLRKSCPPVYNQGDLGSCTANAIGAAFEFEVRKQNMSDDFVPSRLFIYYNERAMEHTIKTDAGAQIRDGIKSVNKQGVCPETMWPYIENKFTKKPSASAFKTALKHQVVSYQSVPRVLSQMKGCLASGYPFVFGFTVYESFESSGVAKTGKLNMPKKSEQSIGGHAVMAVGYDDKAKRFIVRNSWGNDWAINGYFTMPYSYLLNEDLADDFWTVRVVEVSPPKKTAAKKTKK